MLNMYALINLFYKLSTKCDKKPYLDILIEHWLKLGKKD